jgi:hypothetical protein
LKIVTSESIGMNLDSGGVGPIPLMGFLKNGRGSK